MGTWAGRDNSEGQSSVKPLEATGGWRRVFTERLINRLIGNKIGWALKVKYCSSLNLICWRNEGWGRLEGGDT